MNVEKSFWIDYPNMELTPRGKFINDVASLVAQGRIYNPFQQPEAIFLAGYQSFKDWCQIGVYDGQGIKIDRMAYLAYVLQNGALVGNFPGFIKMSKTDFQNQVVPSQIRSGNGLTWEDFSKQKGQSFGGEKQRFTSLVLRDSGSYVVLRCGLYGSPTSTELKELFSLSYVTVVDSLIL